MNTSNLYQYTLCESGKSFYINAYSMVLAIYKVEKDNIEIESIRLIAKDVVT